MKVRVRWFERIALKHFYYHMWNKWPVQVWSMKQGTQSWCTGTTQRDGMGREVGGCFRVGTHVHPWLIHVNVWQKPQYCKAISLQLNKFKKISNSENILVNKMLKVFPLRETTKNVCCETDLKTDLELYWIWQTLNCTRDGADVDQESLEIVMEV